MYVTAEPATARILFVKLPYTLVTEEARRGSGWITGPRSTQANTLTPAGPRTRFRCGVLMGVVTKELLDYT